MTSLHFHHVLTHPRHHPSPLTYPKCPFIIYHFHYHHAISWRSECLSCSSAQNLPGASYLSHCKSQSHFEEQQNLVGYLSFIHPFQAIPAFFVPQNISKLPNRNVSPFFPLCLKNSPIRIHVANTFPSFRYLFNITLSKIQWPHSLFILFSCFIVNP